MKCRKKTIVCFTLLVLIPFSLAIIRNSTGFMALLLITVPIFLLTLIKKDARTFNRSVLIGVLLFWGLMFLLTPQIYIDTYFFNILKACSSRSLCGKGYTYLRLAPVFALVPKDPADRFVNIQWNIIFVYMLISWLVGLIAWFRWDRNKWKEISDQLLRKFT